jgi:glucosylceramidase
MKNKKSIFASAFCALLAWSVQAQTVNWFSSSDNHYWQRQKVRLESRPQRTPDLIVKADAPLSVFRNWGTCFNELGWDALNLLPRQEQEEILKNLFSPEGDLKFTMGRFSMNANDYARNWYSCDEVDGDFGLKYFNIDRDKTTLIPYIKAAQRYNPDMTFWMSPWSPPSWMKANRHYAVRSSAKYNDMSPLSDEILFQGSREKDKALFPQQLAVQDYFIQDTRYLQTYADYFCRFISAYKEYGIPVSMVMFQNESWSYTVYPGCAWTAEGIIRFNTEYLAPALKKRHPEVKLYLGTINTNRYDVIDQVLSDPRMPESIQGVGFQWEGGQILPRIREKYPQYRYVQTEGECGWGSFDWKAAEHTFERINHYLGNGCEEYTFWNAILCDDGTSGWGWKQNALIRVDSKSCRATFTPEYYAVKHYSHFIAPGSEVIACLSGKESGMPVLAVRTPQGKYVVMAANFKDSERALTMQIAGRYLNVKLCAHSLHTFQL